MAREPHPRESSAHDRRHAENMKDPAYREHYELVKAEIDGYDAGWNACLATLRARSRTCPFCERTISSKPDLSWHGPESGQVDA